VTHLALACVAWAVIAIPVCLFVGRVCALGSRHLPPEGS